MDLEPLTISARIELLSAAEGGRKKALHGPISYRPNHNFFGKDDREMCMGTIELTDRQSLAPGEAMNLDMTLWLWPALAREVDIGRRWRIQEGEQLVGWGTVLSKVAE